VYKYIVEKNVELCDDCSYDVDKKNIVNKAIDYNKKVIGCYFGGVSFLKYIFSRWNRIVFDNSWSYFVYCIYLLCVPSFFNIPHFLLFYKLNNFIFL